jgi:hypothetical protein
MGMGMEIGVGCTDATAVVSLLSWSSKLGWCCRGRNGLWGLRFGVVAAVEKLAGGVEGHDESERQGEKETLHCCWWW